MKAPPTRSISKTLVEPRWPRTNPARAMPGRRANPSMKDLRMSCRVMDPAGRLRGGGHRARSGSRWRQETRTGTGGSYERGRSDSLKQSKSPNAESATYSNDEGHANREPWIRRRRPPFCHQFEDMPCGEEAKDRTGG